MRALTQGRIRIFGMGWRVGVLVAILAVLSVVVSSQTDAGETAALLALKTSIGDGADHLANWQGDDPCGGKWTGVYCNAADYPSTLVNSNFSHVTELRLLQLDLKGTLAEEIGNLLAMKVFNVMWNSLTGSIPSSIGNLKNLRLLLLSGNQLTGVLPPELGTLPSLHRLQIDQNRISGPIPDTFLDRNLPIIHHLHMNNNSLNGSIPPTLGTLTNLAHLLLDNNQLTGTLPVELASAPNLMIIQLDNNKFDSTATIPVEYGKIPTLLKLSLRNCNLQGTIPDFSAVPELGYLDLSHNFLEGTIPNTTLSPNISSMDLSFNQIFGGIPQSIGTLPSLQYLVLRDNNLSGTVPANLGTGKMFVDRKSTTLVDLQENGFVNFANGSNLITLAGGSKTKVWLSGNPLCSGSNSAANNPICVPNEASVLLDVGNLNEVFAFDQGSCTPCPAPYSLAPSPSSPIKCRCAAPITVKTRLKSYTFGVFDPYRQQFVQYMAAGLHLQTDQVSIKDLEYEPGPRLAMTLQLFPTTFSFNQSEVNRLYQAWSHWEIPLDTLFGPYEFISFAVAEEGPKRGPSGLSKGAIAGIVIGVLSFVVLKTACIIFVMQRWMRRKQKLDSKNGGTRKAATRRRSYSSILVSSVRSFTFEEMAKATDYFSVSKLVGEGGYGKVYAGILDDGLKVAIKRAEESSYQGAHEFENEIQLLSRIHHKNLVALIGYCNDGLEQMLVYEFIAHGSLQYHLSSHARVPLNFVTRLQIALGSARGIHYLHTEANPPIYHRDVKTSNILLDEKFHAKVSDFGLSKLAPEIGFEGMPGGYISTVVKGTPGYLDPEYFKTHRLTDKSDVYSFGVVLLVLLSGMQPISDGKNLVREVNLAYVAGKMSCIVDPRIKESYSDAAVESLARLALSCCKDGPDERPSIGEVLRELEILYRETYADGTSDRSDMSVGHTGELKKFQNLSESDSFIEINPSVSSSVVSSALWTNSESDLHSTTIIDVVPR